MLRILIIDDELPARNRLRRMLAEVPAVHVAGEAASGQEALSLIPLKEPDVLLLDISMPGLDGITLAQMLREQASPPAVRNRSRREHELAEELPLLEQIHRFGSFAEWHHSVDRWLQGAGLDHREK